MELPSVLRSLPSRSTTDTESKALLCLGRFPIAVVASRLNLSVTGGPMSLPGQGLSVAAQLSARSMIGQGGCP